MQEARKVKKCKKYKNFTKDLRKCKSFLRENNLVAIILSDKTNRLVITEESVYDNKVNSIVKDEETYKKVKSKQPKIENQANMIVKTVCKTLPRYQVQKLLSSGSRPAQLQAFIKDHKARTNESFPLRPIASVRNTAVEKVDWLVSRILTQLVEHVSANVRNSEEVIDGLKKLDARKLSSNQIFISLDVINLYPSIDIGFGIQAVLDLAKKHWQEIDNWHMTSKSVLRLFVTITRLM